MYNFVRYNDANCLHCGKQLPVSTIRQENSRGIVAYHCHKCHTEIVTGVVATHGEHADARESEVSILHNRDSCTIEDNVDWTTWEIWWTDVASVCAINGRVTCGNNELYQFVIELQEEHGTKQTA